MCKNVALEAGPLAGLQKLVLTKRVPGADSKSAPRCFIKKIIKHVVYLVKDKSKQLSRLTK